MKVYIKSVVNISDIQAKIAKKQADIDKKTAWIAKKEASIAKRYAIIEPAVTPEEFIRVQNYVEYLKNNNPYKVPQELQIYDINRKFEWGSKVGEALYGIRSDAESIHNSNESISEYKSVLENYKTKLSAMRDKADEIDRIPECLKGFMNEIIDRWDRYDIKLRDESQPYYNELRHNAWVTLYGDTSSGNPAVAEAKLKELYPDLPTNGYVPRDYRRRKFDEEHITRPFEMRFGPLNYARSLWDETDEQIHAQNKRAGENLILDLLKRVTKITGPVTDWSGLHTTRGNMGTVLNGIVIGEDGRAEVETILAGGYNIQRLHCRTLVKPIR